MSNSSITAIEGLRVGHCADFKGISGCTVILCDEPMVGGIDIRGSAPGTRDTELLRPTHLVKEVNAILLSGGSGFGLEAASGVMRYLEEMGQGFLVRGQRVPIVVAGILFDLMVGDPRCRPDASWAYEACLRATAEEVRSGNVGAGAGATVGKALGMEYCMKGGLGSFCIEREDGLKIGAMVAVNAWGDIFDLEGRIIAGARKAEGKGFSNTLELMKRGVPVGPQALSSTTLAVVATNAAFTKEETNKLAQMAQCGLTRVIVPCNTMYDGDMVFALSKANTDRKADVTVVGSLAAEALSMAVIKAIKSASSLGGIPSHSELLEKGLL